MKRVIKGRVYNFAQNELAEMVTPDTINRIKATDPNPEFRAYVIAHEGEADGVLVGHGRRIFQYFRDAIMKVGQSLRHGTAVFFKHQESGNSHVNREQIGETVGKMFKEIGGKLHAIAAVYVYPSFRGKALNFASIEADLELSLEGGRSVRVDSVETITGIALSDNDRPAFPGATLLGAMQAFSKGQSNRGGVAEGENMTLEEIRQAIKDGKFKVTDIFPTDQLIAVPEVVEHIKKEKQTEYEHAKRLETKLGEEREAHTKTKNELGKQVEEMTAKTVQASSEATLQALVAERKLTSKQTAYAKANMKAFKTEAKDAEGLKKDLNTFLDTQVKAYDETLKVAGLNPAEHGGTGAPPEGETTEQKAAREAAAGKGAGAGDAPTGGTGELDDPNKNDFIPKA